MLVLGLMDVPIFFVNSLNDVGALLFARGADFLPAFGEPQREAMVMLFLRLHHYGEVVNEVFWGLWLLPFGMLVYKSRFLPRLLGVWLMLNCFAYLAQNVTGILLPQYAAVVNNYRCRYSSARLRSCCGCSFWAPTRGLRRRDEPLVPKRSFSEPNLPPHCASPKAVTISPPSESASKISRAARRVENVEGQHDVALSGIDRVCRHSVGGFE